MAWINQLWNLLRRKRLDEDLAEEFQFHLERRVQQNIASGMERNEAEQDARRRFGNQSLMFENAREADILMPLENIAQDVRFATRLMRRRPAFTAMIVLLLGLGIGASTAMFGLLMRAVFPGSAFEKSARLLFLWRFDKKPGRFFERFSDRLSYSDLLTIRHESHKLEDLSIYRFADFNLDASGNAVSIRGFEVEPNWLKALSISPRIGRNILPGERNTALITDDLWKRRFDSDPKVVGRAVKIDNHPFTIIGVLPPGLNFDDADLFTPLVPTAGSQKPAAYYALANVRKGFSLSQAQVEVSTIIPGRDDWTVHLATTKDKTTNACGPTCAQQHRGIWLLFGAASLVMLLACANVANLLLARSGSRRHEFLVRASIGCSRFRLVRQILTESAVLFLSGGALAAILACWFTTALARFAAAYVDVRSVTGSFPLDPRAFLFIALITLVNAILFGVLPAARTVSPIYTRGFRGAIKPNENHLLRNRGRALLVGSEFALSLILLVGFGLLLRSFLAVESIPVGIRTERLLTISGNLARQYQDETSRITFAHGLLEKVRGLPAISPAALTSSLPLTGADDTRVRIEGVPSPPVEVRFVSVSPNFFKTMQLPILAGRPFSDHDSAGSEYVVVINETMARSLFPNGSAIGQRIQMDEKPPVWREIVGVAADVRQRNLEEDSRPVFYCPYEQGVGYNLSLAVRVRSKAEMARVARELHKAVLDADPAVAWEPVESMEQIIHDSESLSLRRPIIRLLGAFGVLALILTAAGLFAVLSYSVIERTREIGIRVALGARRTQVLREIVSETLRFIFPGAIAGAAVAYALSGLLPSGHIGWSGSGVFLYGISRLDGITYLGVFGLLCLICLAAALIPAHRAIQIDPSAVLREE